MKHNTGFVLVCTGSQAELVECFTHQQPLCDKCKMPHDWLCCVLEEHLHFLLSGPSPCGRLCRSDAVLNPQILFADFVVLSLQSLDPDIP